MQFLNQILPVNTVLVLKGLQRTLKVIWSVERSEIFQENSNLFDFHLKCA